jgi:hypothetical protein
MRTKCWQEWVNRRGSLLDGDERPPLSLRLSFQATQATTDSEISTGYAIRVSSQRVCYSERLHHEPGRRSLRGLLKRRLLKSSAHVASPLILRDEKRKGAKGNVVSIAKTCSNNRLYCSTSIPSVFNVSVTSALWFNPGHSSNLDLFGLHPVCFISLAFLDT